MEAEELLQKVRPHLRQNLIPLGLGFLGMIFFIYGLIVLINRTSQPQIQFESAQTLGESSTLTSGKVVVDIEGAVIKPGVFEVSADSRIKDILIKAGGLSSDANREWISKNLNLANKVKDGVKIYIPKVGENIKSSGGSISSESSKGSNEVGTEVNINTASLEELDTLSGVGPVTAQKIIDGRPYGSIEELLEKKVVTGKVFEKIKESITF
ncbi:MAG: helix-hairpin-helix domain-containing protein [Patescibacteria group bacterium]|nr:helix-hairpin-helix domain-containing protein [Patescibacteria group bacterium]